MRKNVIFRDLASLSWIPAVVAAPGIVESGKLAKKSVSSLIAVLGTNAASQSSETNKCENHSRIINTKADF